MNAFQAAKSRHFPKVIGSRREPVSGLAVVMLDCFQGLMARLALDAVQQVPDLIGWMLDRA